MCWRELCNLAILYFYLAEFTRIVSNVLSLLDVSTHKVCLERLKKYSLITDLAVLTGEKKDNQCRSSKKPTMNSTPSTLWTNGIPILIIQGKRFPRTVGQSLETFQAAQLH
jgi:hypothetical protein